MPSIELICVEQQSPIECSPYSFIIESDKELISDRVHSSSFQTDFDSMNGCIYHLLGNEGRTSYDLLKRDWYDEEGEDNGKDDNIEFLSEHEPSFFLLMNELMEASPCGEVVLTSDYQFGPDRFMRFGKMSLSEFITLYENKEVRMNSLYIVTKC